MDIFLGMPSHDIHALWNRKLGVPEAVSRRVDRLIDDSRWHDIGRIVVEGRMDLPFLIVVCHDFVMMLKQYNRSHVTRAFIMHHVLDYVYKVYTSLPVIWKGEWNAERLVNSVLANLREDVNKLVEGDEESVNEIKEVLSQLDKTLNLEHDKVKEILSPDFLKEVKEAVEEVCKLWTNRREHKELNLHLEKAFYEAKSKLR